MYISTPCNYVYNVYIYIIHWIYFIKERQQEQIKAQSLGRFPKSWMFPGEKN